MYNHPFDEKVTKLVVDLMRTHELQLASAIVAATAIANDLTLWTHDTKGFEKLRQLQTFDPFAS
jgi:predicted nucleic acid-binding protein